jgi:hypothetical protein
MDGFSVKFPPRCYMKDRDGERVKLESMVIRETDGDDEERAANQAKAKGGSATPVEELIQLSLVEINGEPANAGKPYQDFARWNTRARGFAQAAWSKINSADKEEVEGFLAGIGEDPEHG